MIPDVSILVVSYNTRDMTLACLTSVVEQTQGLTYEVRLIDNASTDDSFAAISDRFKEKPTFFLSESTANLGFAGANNRLAQEAKGKYLLLLNPDTVILDDAIGKLVAFAKSNPTNRIWGGRTQFANGVLNPTNCWGDMTLWTLFCRAVGLTMAFPKSALFATRSLPNWDRTGIREVPIVTGCFFLITREFWNQLSGFDPQFFMYGEEVDLCLRARRAGARPIVSGAPTIIHHGGASEATREGKLIKSLETELRLLRRHWTSPSIQCGIALVYLRVLVRAFFELLCATIKPSHLWRNVWARRSDWGRSVGGARPSA